MKTMSGAAGVAGNRSRPQSARAGHCTSVHSTCDTQALLGT